MIFNRLSLLSFALAFISIVLVLLNYRPFGLSYFILTQLGFIGFGMMGFLFSMLSIWLDKKRPKNTITMGNNPIFFVGSAIVMLGVGFQFMHWPYSTFLIIGGVLIAGLSFILPNTEEKDDNLLDS